MLRGKTDKDCTSITVRVAIDKRRAFNELAREKGFSPGNLIRNFIYNTVAEAEEKKKAA